MEVDDQKPNVCSGIIVIEDDDAIRESVKLVLEMEGYKVTAFSNGLEAVEGLAKSSDPCLIFLDLMMPVMNGWEFLEARKHIRDAIMAIPVVIVSAWADRAEGTDGVADYLKKPVDVDILLRMAHRYCDMKRRAA